MRRVLGSLGLVPVLALALGAYWQVSTPDIGAYTVTVTIYDNDAPLPSGGFDPGQGWWNYAPSHVQVQQGEPIVFNNAASNRWPHTVTSLDRSGTSYAPTFTAGGRFDSSPDQASNVPVGGSWTLDTGSLPPGNYAYYCRLHAWMVASISVAPR